MNHYNNSQFGTYDLALASALVSSGCKLTGIEKTQYGNRASFIFERTGELDSTVQAFWRDELQVNPKQYFDVLKHIKTRLYSGEHYAAN